MTGTELFSEIDDQLSDTQPNTDIKRRWPNAKKLVYLNDSVQAMWVRFFEAFCDDEVPTDPPEFILITQLGEDLPTSNRYNTNHMNFVIGRCLGEDSEDASNQALSIIRYQQSGMES